MTTKITVASAVTDEPMTIKVGDWVGFKCDVEQYGQVVEIRRPLYAFDKVTLILRNPDGFEGEYIGGDTETSERAEDVWTD